MKKKNGDVLFKYAFILLLSVFLVMYGIMAWKQCTVFDESIRYYHSDLDEHLCSGMGYTPMDMNGDEQLQNGMEYTLLRNIIRPLHRLFGENVFATTVIYVLLLTICNGITVLLLCYAFKKMYDIQLNKWVYFFSLSSVLVASFFTHYDNLSVQTLYPNVWHSPTLFLMRPAAIGVVIWTAMMFKEGVKGKPIGKYMLLNAIATFLCMWAKPSFLASFLPAMCVFLLIELIRSKGKSLLFSLKLGLSYAGVLPLLIYQYLALFGKSSAAGGEAMAGGESITVYIKTIWSFKEIIKAGYDIWFSSVFILAGLLLLYCFKITDRKILLFTGLYYISSEIFHLFAKETGPRAAHGNFSWSAIIMLFVLMAFVAGEIFLNPSGKKIPVKWRWVAGILYAGHLVTGILYFIHMYQGGYYNYFM